MNLKSIGYYREMSQGCETDPSIHDAVMKGNPDIIDKICNYLNDGLTVIISPGITTDIIDESAGVVGTGSSCTDGIWLWPDDLAYYVHKYNISLPEDFINTMKRNNWNNPAKNLDLINDEIFVDGIN